MKPLSIIELQIAEPNSFKLNHSLGSVFHGALMGVIDTDYAEYLHTMSLRPYSQCLYYDKSQVSWIWRLTSFHEEAREQILEKIFRLRKIYLRNKGTDVLLSKANVVKETTFTDLLDKHFAQSQASRRIKINFLSPTSFKSDNAYMFYPSERLIIGSLLNKWNKCCDTKLEENNLLENLAGETFTHGYSLRMNPFSLEGTWVPAFKGSLTLGLKSNIMANRIIRLLCEFSQFAGVGIKTALGMGGVECSFE